MWVVGTWVPAIGEPGLLCSEAGVSYSSGGQASVEPALVCMRKELRHVMLIKNTVSATESRSVCCTFLHHIHALSY